MLIRHGLFTLALALAACGKAAPPEAPTSAAKAPRAAPDASAGSGDAAAKTHTDDAATVSDVHEYIVTTVRAGYATRDEIIGSVVDVFAEGIPGVDLTSISARVADQELAAQRQREASWTAPTDCDRLDHAFSQLEQGGIVARQNFSDCGTCGASEIVDEIEQAKEAGQKPRGYVFFHQQDSEAALDGSLYLSYGSPDDPEEAQLAIAREVLAALTKAGLSASWNGRLDTRVLISPIDWRKRRFTKAPAL